MMDHSQFLFEPVIEFPAQLLLENADGHQDGTVLISSTNQSQISNQNMVEMGKKLLEAASENNVDAVRSLMSGGAPFTGNWLGTTPLHAAAKAGHIETVELLLKAGIFRDAKTKVERTALQMAAEEGHTTIVQMLLQYGADVNAKDMLKMTALHWAVERCHKDSIIILLAHGADIAALNKFDKTPLDIAYDNGLEEIIKLIEEASSGSCVAGAQSVVSETRIATEKLENELRQDTPKEDWKTSPEEDALEKLTANTRNSSSREAVKLLESHGISFLPTDNSTMVTSALESGQSIGLTEAGKMALKQTQTTNISSVKTMPQPSVAKKPKIVTPQSNGTGLPRVVTLTADQLLALATKLQAKGSNKPVFITLPKNVGPPAQGKLPVNRCTKPTIAPAILKKPAPPRVSSLSEFLAAKSVTTLEKTTPNPIKEVQPLLSMPNLTDDAFSESSADNQKMSLTHSETIVPDSIALGFDQFVHTTPSEETIETSVVTTGSIEVSSHQDSLLIETDLSSQTKPVELDKKMYFLKSGLLKGSARTTPMTLLWKRKRKHSSMDEEPLDTEVTASVAMTPVESHPLRRQPTLNNAAAPLDADDDMFINDESGSGHGHNPPVWLSIMEENQFSADNDDDLLDPTKLATQLASIRQAASQFSFSS